MGALGRPAVPRLHLITNRRLCSARPQVEIVAEAVRGGIEAVQLREKELDQRALHGEAMALLAVLSTTPLIVNGSVTVAQAVGAAGVHLPERVGSVAAVRATLGPHALVGRSAHDLAGARAAVADGVDYLILGTIFATASKPGREPAGLDLVRAVARAVTVPIIAIGGITETNAAATLSAGAWGIAVMSGILCAPDPADAARRLRAAIEIVHDGDKNEAV